MIDHAEPDLIDDDRLTELIRIGLRRSPDPVKLWRYLKTGATFYVRMEGDRVHLILRHDPETAGDMSRLRVGTEIAPDPDDLGVPLSVIRAPASVLKPKPQG